MPPSRRAWRRLLGKYVREDQVIALEEAVRKVTSLPAAHFGFADRGLITVGHAADLVLFDPRTVADRATFDAPHPIPPACRTCSSTACSSCATAW